MIHSFTRLTAVAVSIFIFSLFTADSFSRADAGQRGFRILAGSDSTDRGNRHRRHRGVTIIVLQQPEEDDPADEPLDIKPLNPVSRVIHVTAEQARVGRERAALRGAGSAEPISVIAGEERAVEHSTQGEYVDNGVNEDSPQVIYFND